MRRIAFVAILCALGGMEAAWSQVVAIRATKIYPAPDQPAIADGVVLMHDGKLAMVGPREQVKIPKGATISECSGVVTAGFQNSHVHFTEEVWKDAAHAPAAALSRGFESMLTRFGFTTVFDTGSDGANTIALRARVATGEVQGPRILTVGLPLYPPDGIPHYISDLPAEVLARMHLPKTAAEARDAVRQNLAAGAEGTKLFLVTSPRPNVMRYMSLEVARAAVEETHRGGKLAFAHPTSLEGIRVALAAGVDVLVHTTLGEPAPWDAELVRQMTSKQMSVIPTFKLWTYELKKGDAPAEIINRLVGATHEELRAFAGAGGQVLFGTDVGYMHEYDPSDEYTGMAKAGMTPLQILASLTTAPAARLNEGTRRGRLVANAVADVVVLAGDPAEDVRNFARVRCVFRGGVPIYSASAP